jgi:large subunit ribosomal protein L10
MKRIDKEQIINMLHDKFSKAYFTVLLNFKGMDVAEFTELRRKLVGSSVDFQVLKNTLAKKAIINTEIVKMESYFQGQTAVATCNTDSLVGLKILDQFSKENKSLAFKAAVIDGNIISKEDIRKFIDLPSRDVLLSLLLNTLKSPSAQLLKIFTGHISGLVNILINVKESKN